MVLLLLNDYHQHEKRFAIALIQWLIFTFYCEEFSVWHACQDVKLDRALICECSFFLK